VPPSPWQQSIDRTRVLARLYPSVGEILSFYAHVAGLQERQYRQLETRTESAVPGAELSQGTVSDFVSFVAAIEGQGPQSLRDSARYLRQASADSSATLLNACWQRPELSPSLPQELLARAFLQPYAVLTRLRSGADWGEYNRSLCPFCGRKPGAGILRPRGDGGSRSLLCSFCLAEWDFRRIVCAGCGEEDYKKLPVYTANDFEYVRVESCDTCKQYLKTIDLTKNGLANPVVDEIATAPLDLWAQEQGYSKLELNLVGM
jgi:formate dehydrogenase accessory protein FdhE